VAGGAVDGNDDGVRGRVLYNVAAVVALAVVVVGARDGDVVALRTGARVAEGAVDGNDVEVRGRVLYNVAAVVALAVVVVGARDGDVVI
jgi:hypothetical protein